MILEIILIAIILYKKVIFFEDKIADIQEQIRSAVNNMREIDLKGAFESDDEVGEVFRLMNVIVQSLGEYIYGEEAEE